MDPTDDSDQVVRAGVPTLQLLAAAASVKVANKFAACSKHWILMMQNNISYCNEWEYLRGKFVEERPFWLESVRRRPELILEELELFPTPDAKKKERYVRIVFERPMFYTGRVLRFEYGPGSETGCAHPRNANLSIPALQDAIARINGCPQEEVILKWKTGSEWVSENRCVPIKYWNEGLPNVSWTVPWYDGVTPYWLDEWNPQGDEVVELSSASKPAKKRQRK